jgi:hypothetical protein
MAYLCWPIALAHTFGMGTDSGEPWVIALGVACVASVGVGLVWRLRFMARQAAAEGVRTTSEGSPKHLVLSAPRRESVRDA